MRRKRIGQSVVAGLVTYALAATLGCGGSDGTGRSARVRGDVTATQASWAQCSAIKRHHADDLKAIWFRSIRPAAVEQIMSRTGSQLRAVDTKNVDPVVIDHINRAITSFEKMGDLLGSKGTVALYDEFMPSDGSLLLGSISRQKTGHYENLHRALDEIKSELDQSERQTILHMRETYGVELKPW
jgi:hypothetical protein